jgi:hypothetical protein
MYDSWAAYDAVADPFLLGQTVAGYSCPFDGIATPDDVKLAREEAISFASYRLMRHRFARSPRVELTNQYLDSLMVDLGYDASFTSTDYSTGSPAALGNYIAQSLIAFGLQDGSNEANVYANRHYQPVNPPLIATLPGNPTLVDPNRWQPLALDKFVDQSGNTIPGATPPFLSPEWGEVVPFSLPPGGFNVYHRDDYDYQAYHDPGPPPFLDATSGAGIEDDYKWTFTLVSTWSSHLDATDGVMWDISPASIGNNAPLPTTLAGYRDFYDILEGGDSSRGRTINPSTGQPYQPQIVPRGDYTRCLAEFWADGPASETPPGHWFTILNEAVHDHPAFERRFKGVGPVIDPLEWDVKAYLALGGCMHDVAITAWGIKGCYDYIRPISALRAMADKGQSTNSSLPRYDPAGIPLIPDYVELVETGDPLEGDSGENVGKIKIKAWKGPAYINVPEDDVAGVDWILAENWWPYQRPTFITPPFAGYISGHSTYSRAAAELLTLLTGDEYFPGGMEFRLWYFSHYSRILHEQMPDFLMIFHHQSQTQDR